MGGVPPHRRSSHGTPVTESPDPSFSMVLGCHGSCFTNYPGGHKPTLCPYFVPAVCIVHGIIFPNSKSSLRQWTAAEMTVTSLTQERQGKYKLRKGECTALTYWLPLFVLDAGWFKKKKKPSMYPVTRRVGLYVWCVCHQDSNGNHRTFLSLLLSPWLINLFACQM